MKKLLMALGLVCAFQLHCKAMMQSSENQINFELGTIASKDFDTYFYVFGSSFESGFRNAITFPMEETLKNQMFGQGMEYVKKGEFNLMFIREFKRVPYPYGVYVAHILYAIQPCYNGEWTRVRHGGYLGDENLWFAGFATMFEEIQKITKKPLACLVYDAPENETWKRVITLLGFVARPDIPREADDQDCTWYVRPFAEVLRGN